MITDSRFVVGIDLGTTNNSVAYVDMAMANNDRPAIRSVNHPPGVIKIIKIQRGMPGDRLGQAV